jgi:hypothetical protein
MTKRVIHHLRNDCTRNDDAQAMSNASLHPAIETAASEVPVLSVDDQRFLASFQRRQNVLRDLTIGCVRDNHTGAYIAAGCLTFP